MNIKNHTVYSDKMQLSVLNLTRKDLATEEDKDSHLHYWASFFKATTWEELKMLAKQDEFIKEASATIYQLSQEEQVRLQCEAREDYYRRQRTIQHTIENQNITIENQSAIIKQLTDETVSQKKKITSQEDKIASQEDKITSQEDKIASLQCELTSLREEITSLTKLLLGQGVRMPE